MVFSILKFKIVLVHLILLLFTGIVFLVYLSNEYSYETILKIISLVFIICSIWELWSWTKISGNIFNLYFLFLLSSIIFNGGQIFLEVMDLNKFGIFGGRFSEDIVIRTIFFITVGMSFFHFGALLAYNEEKSDSYNIESPFDNEQSILWVGWFLFLISIVPAIYLLKNSLSSVMSFGYFSLFQGEKVTGIASTPKILMNFITPAAIFILIGGRKNKKYVLFSLSVVVVFMLIRFFLGDRSSAIMPVIAYTWVWHKIIKPIPAPLLLISGGVVLLIIFPLISLTRNISGAYRFDLTFLQKAFLTLDNPVITIFSEMGGTAKTVAHTIDLVPTVKEYELGRSYFYGLYSIIPNFFAEVHPAKAYGTPSDWLIWTVNPWMAKKGGGLGYSFIAEAYLNFGFMAGLFTLGGLGYFLSKIFNLANNKNKVGRIALVAAFFAFAIKYTRADINSVIRPLIWYALFPYLLIYAHYILKKFYFEYFKIYRVKKIND